MSKLRFTPSSRVRSRAAYALLAVLPLSALGLTACGSSSADASDNSTASTTAITDPALKSLYDQAVASGQTTITIYGPTTPGEATAGVFAKFTAQFPKISVKYLNVVGPDLQQKVSAEISSGKHIASLVETGASQMVQFTDSGWFVAFTPSTAGALPSNDSYNGTIFVDELTPEGVLYNTNMVDSAHVPTSYDALLTDSYWTGKMEIRDPATQGVGAGTVAALIGAGLTDTLQDLKNQKVKISPSNNPSANITDVASGSAAVTMGVPYGQALTAIKGHAPIKFVFPLDNDNYLSATSIAVVKDTPALAAAELYESWLFTPGAQSSLAKTNTYSPIPGATPPQGLPPLDQVKVGHVADLQHQSDSQKTELVAAKALGL